VTDATAVLRALATRVVELSREHTKPRAALLTGSAARGDAGPWSDLDLILYYDELPPRAATDALRDAAGGTLERVIWDGSDGYTEQFIVDGISCQVAHSRLADLNQELGRLVSGEPSEVPLEKIASGLLEGLVFAGPEVIEALRARLVFTDERRRHVIERHWRFFPLWYFAERWPSADAELWRYQVLVESAFDLVACLAALNRRWFTSFQFKRTRALLDGLELAPPRLADRLESLFTLPVAESTAELESLVRETQALLREHVPEVDAELPRPPGSRQRPWGP